MRVSGAVFLSLTLGACAFPAQVQRFGVEYNSALAEMSNEQTLLNILRARDGMPTHFTSVSQFRGNINLTASASLNGQLRGEGLTQAIVSGFTNTAATTATTTTNVSAPGAPPSVSTVASTVTTPVSNGSTTSTVAEGVDLYTPQISGQIVSGTNLDVAVFDTQKFYQGITAAIPFSTIETLLLQGIDNRVISLLTIARIDFRMAEDREGYAKGDLFWSIVNDPTEVRTRTPNAAGIVSEQVSVEKFEQFVKFVNCYELGSGLVPKEATNLIAMSRITRGADGKPIPIALDKAILIDGEKYGFSGQELSGDPKNDDNIYLTRVTGEKRVARLARRDASTCRSGKERVENFTLSGGEIIQVVVPEAPTAEPIYLGGGKALIYSGKQLREVKVSMEVSFRSPEGMFRYLGAYLRSPLAAAIPIDGQPLFTINEGRLSDALARASYRGKNYSLIDRPGGGARNAQIFTLLQQLVNLHKEATERPTAIPVRAIP